MSKPFVFLFALFFSGFSFSSHLHAQSKAKDVYDKMIASINTTQQVFVHNTKVERQGLKMVKGETIMKVQHKPYKLYMFQIEPNKGTEILWVTGWNEGKAHVSPKSFPYVPLNLDPYGNIMLKGQHHPIFHAGMLHFGKVVSGLYKRYGSDFDKYVKHKGMKDYKGRKVHVLELAYDDYHFVDYTVKSGDNVLKIAEKLNIPAYKVVELNASVKGFFDVTPGQVIKVPSIFAKGATFYIDSQDYLPRMYAVYDDKGIYEKHDFIKLRKNPNFKSAEFTTDWPEYGF